MYRLSIYLTTILLVVNLISCQSDGTGEPEVTVDQSKTSKTKVAEGPIELSSTKEAIENKQEAILIKEKQEKLAKLKAQKEELDAKRLETERIEEEKKVKERAARRKRAKIREEKRLAEEENQRRLASQSTSSQIVEEFEEIIPEEPAEPQGKLQFVSRSHDFGKIMEGDTFEHEFKFYNASQIPVVISNVKASCGCTKTTYPKEPILPGENGTIGVTFDSKGKLGRQKPFMSVVTNGNPSIYSLYMDGTVDTKRE